MDEMAGVGVVVEPPPAGSPEPELALKPPPPHRFSKAATPRAKTKARANRRKPKFASHADSQQGTLLSQMRPNQLAVWNTVHRYNASVELWQMFFGNSVRGMTVT